MHHHCVTLDGCVVLWSRRSYYGQQLVAFEKLSKGNPAIERDDHESCKKNRKSRLRCGTAAATEL